MDCPACDSGKLIPEQINVILLKGEYLITVNFNCACGAFVTESNQTANEGIGDAVKKLVASVG